jgi:hypothetical protein
VNVRRFFKRAQEKIHDSVISRTRRCLEGAQLAAIKAARKGFFLKKEPKIFLITHLAQPLLL